jgi:hypothetical protein
MQESKLEQTEWPPGAIIRLRTDVAQTEEAAEKEPFVIPSEARDLRFFATRKKQQIPRAKLALRNETLRVFSQLLKPAPHETSNASWPNRAA